MLLISLTAAAGMVAWVLWRTDEVAPRYRIGFQDADAPLQMPASGEPDHRFHMLSAWQKARVPRSLRFDPPLGSEHSAMVYNAQKFWEMNEKRGGHHTGDDLNGIGGMDTDLGDPVFSTADGLVIYAGEPSPGWGKVVVLAHQPPTGPPLHSMYAHLDRIDVPIGALISRGGRIGTVGTGNGYYPAHLHFEIRASDGVDIGAGYSMFPLNRLDPTATVGSLRNAMADDLSPAPLARVLAVPPTSWTDLDIKGGENIPGISGDDSEQ